MVTKSNMGGPHQRDCMVKISNSSQNQTKPSQSVFFLPLPSPFFLDALTVDCVRHGALQENCKPACGLASVRGVYRACMCYQQPRRGQPQPMPLPTLMPANTHTYISTHPQWEQGETLEKQTSFDTALYGSAYVTLYVTNWIAKQMWSPHLLNLLDLALVY